MTYQILLDTSSLMYRAFFALPQSITDSDEQPINAVHGYLDMTTRVHQEYSPDLVLHVFDHDWRPAVRVEAYPGYKAERPDDPESLPPQFDRLRQVLAAAGMAWAEAEGWEADDAIGSLCAQAQPDDHIDIVTGDRDLLQLVQDKCQSKPQVRLLYTLRGVSELKVFDESLVQQEYGIPPARYVDFAILRGDPSDGLPGIKGIGEKTAAKLINQYPGLNALLDDVAAQTPRLRQNLDEGRDYIHVMRNVVPIRMDLEVTIRHPDCDDARLDQLAETLGLTGPVRRWREVANS